jgi:hypothetical protein
MAETQVEIFDSMDVMQVKTLSENRLEPTIPQTQGIKFDGKKPRTDLIPWEAIDLLEGKHLANGLVEYYAPEYRVLKALEYITTRIRVDPWHNAFALCCAALQNLAAPDKPPRLDHVSLIVAFPLALLQIGYVLGHGAQKYADRQWEHGMKFSRLQAAAQRHLLTHLGGELNDPESGRPHLAHAACCLLFILTFIARGRAAELDDTK